MRRVRPKILLMTGAVVVVSMEEGGRGGLRPRMLMKVNVKVKVKSRTYLHHLLDMKTTRKEGTWPVQ